MPPTFTLLHLHHLILRLTDSKNSILESAGNYFQASKPHSKHEGLHSEGATSKVVV